MRFKAADYFFVALLIVAIIGFWPSYFSKLFNGTADFTQYFHFHSVTATLWIVMLIIQPMLIRRKKFALHRKVGALSYVLVPILFVSILLLAHHRVNLQNIPRDLWITFKDLLIFSFGFGVAVVYRKEVAIHARGMVVAGMALIEPAMVRVMFNVADVPAPTGYLLAISVVYLTLAVLIFREWKEPTPAKWVFRIALVLFLFIHTVLLTNWMMAPWKAFANWFVSLPLT